MAPCKCEHVTDGSIHSHTMDKAVGAVSLLAVAPAVVAQATTTQNQLPQILQHVDRLYEENQMQEALAYLEPLAHWEEGEVLWRLARLCYKVGKYYASSQDEARRLAERGLVYAERSVSASSKNFACHKWMGIVLSWASDFEGYRRKIERSFDIRGHFLVGREGEGHSYMHCCLYSESVYLHRKPLS